MVELDGGDITSIDGLISALRAASVDSNGGFRRLWFRGHAVFEWKLVPSLVRLVIKKHGVNVEPKFLANREKYALRRFQQMASAVLSNRVIQGEAEWLLLMQHYRMPTRLLDWTENPLVALYFAVGERGHADKDGALWVLNPLTLNKKVLKLEEDAEALVDMGDESIRSYMPTSFTAIPSDQNPVAVIAKRNDPRVIAQQGVFTIHASLLSLEEFLQAEEANASPGSWTLKKHRIPSGSKEALLEELKLLGVEEASLFPDLEHVAAFVKGEVEGL